MNRLAILAALLATPASVLSATELKVDVYDGPKECDDADKVKSGQYLSMHYTGTIDESSETGEKGKQFDSSRTRVETFDFQIGQGSVIKGGDQGLLGLCKGAKATIVIPPEMGYGASGAGANIPGGATLNFDVEVVDISGKAPAGPNYFAIDFVFCATSCIISYWPIFFRQQFERFGASTNKRFRRVFV